MFVTGSWCMWRSEDNLELVFSFHAYWGLGDVAQVARLMQPVLSPVESSCWPCIICYYSLCCARALGYFPCGGTLKASTVNIFIHLGRQKHLDSIMNQTESCVPVLPTPAPVANPLLKSSTLQCQNVTDLETGSTKT